MKFKFTIKQNPLQIEFDSDTVNEAAQILVDNESELSRIFGRAAALGSSDDEDDESGSDDSEAPKKRKRRTKAEIAAQAAPVAPEAPAVPAPVEAPAAPAPASPPEAPAAPAAPVTASAPPPAPVPDTGTVAPEIAIPANLVRAPEPAPPAPVAPPEAPAVERSCDRVIAELKRRAAGSVDGGKSLVDWLGASGIVNIPATFDEALAVIQLLEEDKVAPLLKPLGLQ